LSSSNYTNALKFLQIRISWCWSLTRDKERKGDQDYYPVEDKRALDSLKQRVFRFL